MANKKNFQGKDTFHRVNFLYQAADICRKLPGAHGKKLMMIYGSHMTSVCRKTVSRMDMHMKRKICKGCCGLLVPGDTAIVRLTKKPESQVVWICTMCGAFRLFNTQPDHRIWRDTPDAVIEKIDLNSHNSVGASSSTNIKLQPKTWNPQASAEHSTTNVVPSESKRDNAMESSCSGNNLMDLERTFNQPLC